MSQKEEQDFRLGFADGRNDVLRKNGTDDEVAEFAEEYGSELSELAAAEDAARNLGDKALAKTLLKTLSHEEINELRATDKQSDKGDKVISVADGQAYIVLDKDGNEIDMMFDDEFNEE